MRGRQSSRKAGPLGPTISETKNYDGDGCDDGGSDDGDDNYDGGEKTKGDLWCWCSVMMHCNALVEGKPDTQDRLFKAKSFGIDSDCPCPCVRVFILLSRRKGRLKGRW